MELNEAEAQVKRYLEAMRDLKRSTYHLEQLRNIKRTMGNQSSRLEPVNGAVYGVYYGMEDFLLQHGVWYRPVGQPPRKGAPNLCFGNALFYSAIHAAPYIEGMALASGIPVLVHHAWNLDDQGSLADATWMNAGVAYLGVEFSVGRASNAMRFEDGTVLDNPRDKWKIYKEPWQGENFNLCWRKWKPIRRLLKEIQRSPRRDFRNRLII